MDSWPCCPCANLLLIQILEKPLFDMRDTQTCVRNFNNYMKSPISPAGSSSRSKHSCDSVSCHTTCHTPGSGVCDTSSHNGRRCGAVICRRTGIGSSCSNGGRDICIVRACVCCSNRSCSSSGGLEHFRVALAIRGVLSKQHVCSDYYQVEPFCEHFTLSSRCRKHCQKA